MIFKLSLREIRNSKIFSLVFVINTTLGLLGFVTLNSFKESLDTKLASRAREMLTADLSISGRKDLTELEVKKTFEYLQDKINRSAYNIQIYSMVRTIEQKGDEGRVRLAQIQGIDKNYPLYGELEVKEKVKRDELFKTASVWIAPELSHQLKLERGDRVTIGKKEFTVGGIIAVDSTKSFQGVGLAPKLYMSREALLETDLVGFGSIAVYRRYFEFKPDLKISPKEIKEHLFTFLTDPALNINLPENSSEQVGRVLGYLTDYLGLVALVALFLSGVGASYLFQSFLFARFKEIGILKSLGLKRKKILSLYSLQIFILGVAASLLALGAASALSPLVEKLLKDNLALDIAMFLSLKTITISLMIGVVSSLLVCGPVLIKILSHPTTDLFSDIQLFKWNWKIKDMLLFFPLILLFWVLAIWQASSIKVGSLFTGAILISSILFLTLFPLFLRGIEKIFFSKKESLRSPGGFSFSMGLRNLTRHRLSSTMSFLALSIGVMLMSLIVQLEASLKGELLGSVDNRPSLFLFDIQEGQDGELEAFLEEKNLPLAHLAPMVRARITKINDKEYKREDEDLKFATREEQNEARFRNRGVNLSYALELNSSERLVEGEAFLGPFDEKSGELPLISLEKRYADRMKIELGDTVSFDILGVQIKAKVSNLRSVRWTSFIPNFFIIFQPGVLEDAPKTFLAALGEMSQEKNFEAQDMIVEKFSNISIINVAEVIEEVLTIFSLMSKAIFIMAILCLIVGFVVLYSITEHQTRRRSVELSLYKILGLKAMKVQKFLFIEFILMALMSIVIGASLSLILGKVVAVLFFDNVWTIDIISLLMIAVSVLVMTLLTVYSASNRILNKSAFRFLLDDAK